MLENKSKLPQGVLTTAGAFANTDLISRLNVSSLSIIQLNEPKIQSLIKSSVQANGVTFKVLSATNPTQK